eukprot:2025881-Prymnesium_polylepis.1
MELSFFQASPVNGRSEPMSEPSRSFGPPSPSAAACFLRPCVRTSRMSVVRTRAGSTLLSKKSGTHKRVCAPPPTKLKQKGRVGREGTSRKKKTRAAPYPPRTTTTTTTTSVDTINTRNAPGERYRCVTLAIDPLVPAHNQPKTNCARPSPSPNRCDSRRASSLDARPPRRAAASSARCSLEDADRGSPIKRVATQPPTTLRAREWRPGGAPPSSVRNPFSGGRWRKRPRRAPALMRRTIHLAVVCAAPPRRWCSP